MIVRKLTEADAEAFRAIRIEMCREHPEAFNQTPEEVLSCGDDKIRDWIEPSDSFPEKFILAACEDDRILATVCFRREDLAKESHRGWIWGVYVRREARGRNLSRLLMQKAIDEARKMPGLERLVLSVALTQTAARTLYTSLGFITTGLNPLGLKLSDGRYVDFEEMVLRL